MKLRELSRKEARNFVISWTATYLVFSLMVVWSLIHGFEIERKIEIPHTLLWPHVFLMLAVLLSLFVGIFGMWKRYFSGEFSKIRAARNMSFYIVLFLFPLGIILNLIMISL